MSSPDDTGRPSTSEKIVDALRGAATEVVVADVRIGLGYTAVMLADGRTGLAFTFRDDANGGCSPFRGIRPLSGRNAGEVLALLRSSDVLEAAVGLACANALANSDNPVQVDGDILDVLDLRGDDRVGMVGHFGPLVTPIQQRARSLVVFERVHAPAGLLRPTEDAAAELPRCDVALVTATSIVNHTIDGLLGAASGCREVAVLGPSTPLLPGVFGAPGSPGVTLLSGVVVTDSSEVLRTVSEGGGMRQFGPHVRKVTVRVSGPRGVSTRSMA